MTPDQLRRIAQAATEGPWVVGEPYDVQGALQCRCEGKGPLVWEGQANINGEMMLTHVHEPSESRKEIFSGDTSIYTKSVPHAYVVALSTSEYCEISKEDAEFIATFNPQKVLELLARLAEYEQAVENMSTKTDDLLSKLAAVEKLHQPKPNTVSALYPNPLCLCGKEYPCPTIKAVRGE